MLTKTKPAAASGTVQRTPFTETKMATYAICCTARSGATLLCDLLESNGLGLLNDGSERPGEFLNPYFGLLPPDRQSKMNELKAAKTTPHGVFGVKVSWDVYESWRQWLQPTHHIYVTRRDIDKQAVSLYICDQTDDWTRPTDPEKLARYHEKRKAVEFNPAKILELQQKLIIDQNNEWEDGFARMNVTPLRLVYEDFCEQPAATVKQVAKYLGETPPRTVNVAPEHQREWDGLNEWLLQELYSFRRSLR